VGRNVQAILIAVAAFILLAVVILFVLIEMPRPDTATWEAANGRYLGHWRVASGEDRRFPAFVAGREDLRIEEVVATGPGTHGRDVVVSWNGVPYPATAQGLEVLYVDPAAAPAAPPGSRSDGFTLYMLTLQFDGMIEALESIEVDDPDFDQLFIDFRAGRISMTKIGRDGDCVRYERVVP
jgi:hypothetical protein